MRCARSRSVAVTVDHQEGGGGEGADGGDAGIKATAARQRCSSRNPPGSLTRDEASSVAALAPPKTAPWPAPVATAGEGRHGEGGVDRRSGDDGHHAESELEAETGAVDPPR